jgi:acetaldehyde dehydrogenase (acetylating)
MKIAILGTGNIGTDLLMKIRNRSTTLEVALFAGIDPESEGIARARSLGVPTATNGIDGVLAEPDIGLVFEATSAPAHLRHAPLLKDAGKIVVDLTPAAVGPFVVPAVRCEVGEERNVNLVSCGGQAVIPMVHAVSRVAPLEYAETVTTIASRSAGPGTRANIDEFTVTTARGVEEVGGAPAAKSIIILNPADPPILKQDTVYVVDSAGAMVPDDVRAKVSALRQALSCAVGFHAHNNLGLAIGNSLAAVEEGAAVVDGSLAGLGAGAGNAPTEVLIAVLDKSGYETGVDLYGVMDAAEDVVRPLLKRPQMIDKPSLSLGYAGVYSSFLLHTFRVVKKVGLDPRDVLIELGKRRVVGGQEDMILDVAMQLKREKEEAAKKATTLEGNEA